ncbi:MAG: HAMP domain-containing sensor histidine kinase, partial [Burkholderiales bacterium]
MLVLHTMPWIRREIHPQTPQKVGRDREIQFEQILNVHREYLPGAIPAALGGLLVVVVMWRDVYHSHLLIWLGLLYILTAIRTFFYVRIIKSPPSIYEIDRWKWGFLLGTAGAGAIWGSTGVFMLIPDSLPLQMFILSCLFAICAGAVSVFGHYLPAFCLYASLLIVPSIVTHVILGSPIHWVIAAICSIFLISFMGFARRHSRFVEQSLRMRHENNDLIVELREQKLAAEQARNDAQRATLEAEQANRAKSHFLATASHDLRQPLQAIALFSEALKERIYYPEVRSIVDNINASVSALQSLFNELLDISRLEAGVIEAIPVNFRVAVLLDKLRTDYTPAAREKQLRISIAPSHYALFTDPMLLERVVRNFVSNAIRYTPKHGAIVVGCRWQSDGRIRIEIRDNGIGIAADQQQKIFEEFYQVDNPERDRRKGFGLGLAIA